MSHLNGATVIHNTIFSEDSLFNHATCILTKDVNPLEIIETVENLFNSLKLQPCIYVSPLDNSRDLEKIMLQRGYVLYDELITMECEINGEVLSNEDVGVQKINRSETEKWCQAFMSSFDIAKSWEDEVNNIIKSLVSRPEVNLLAIYKERRIVGTTALYSTEKKSGIYCVGTLPSERQSGIASKLIRGSLSEINLLGRRNLCLQTLRSANVEKFYIKRGFNHRYTKRIYVKG